MLTREEVFIIIDRERAYQDMAWPPHEGHKNSEHAIVLADLYIGKAKQEWLNADDDTGTAKQLAKLAAILVRALENITGSEELLKGLR